MEHKPGYIVIIVLSVVFFITTLIFNSFAAGAFGETALFHNITGHVSNAYYLEITPAGWTFSIWILIYTWLGLWLLYSLTTICRTTSYGYLYVSPAHMPPIVFIMFMFNNIMNVSWLLMWDRFYQGYALMFILLTTLSLYIVMYFACYQLHASTAILLREDKIKDIWVTRVLLLNGVALYTAWVTIASLLNLAIVLTYDGGLKETLSSTITLSLILVFAICWFFMESVLLDTYLRYILSPYIALILALAGSIYKNWDLTQNNSVLSVFALAVIVVLALCKIILLFIRHYKRPIHNRETGLTFYHSYTSEYGAISKSYEKFPIT